jgi:hypothetical protein
MKTLNSIPLTFALAQTIAGLPTVLDRTVKNKVEEYAEQFLANNWKDDPTGMSFTGPSLEALELRLNGGNRARARILAEGLAKSRGVTFSDPLMTVHLEVKKEAFAYMDIQATRTLAFRTGLEECDARLVRFLQTLKFGSSNRPIDPEDAKAAFEKIKREAAQVMASGKKPRGGVALQAAALIAILQDPKKAGDILKRHDAFVRGRKHEWSPSLTSLEKRVDEIGDGQPLLKYAYAHKAYTEPQLAKLTFKGRGHNDYVATARPLIRGILGTK